MTPHNADTRGSLLALLSGRNWSEGRGPAAGEHAECDCQRWFTSPRECRASVEGPPGFNRDPFLVLRASSVVSICGGSSPMRARVESLFPDTRNSARFSLTITFFYRAI